MRKVDIGWRACEDLRPQRGRRALPVTLKSHGREVRARGGERGGVLSDYSKKSRFAFPHPFLFMDAGWAVVIRWANASFRFVIIFINRGRPPSLGSTVLQLQLLDSIW